MKCSSLLRVAALALLLAGCQTMAGSGPLVLWPEIEQKIDLAVAEHGEKLDAMAVSTDGKSMSFMVCEYQYCSGNPVRMAIASCERHSYGKKCYLFMRGTEVVWDYDGAPRDDDVSDVVKARLTLTWTDSKKTVETGLVWLNSLKTRGSFYHDDEAAALKSCTGTITREPEARNGLWQMNCHNGVPALAGKVTFSDGVVEGQGKTAQGQPILLTVR